MIRLNVHEAKTHLSKYLDRLGAGETILLCKRNTPIAEIRGLARTRKAKRPIGLAKGEFKISRKFFDPLPEEIVNAFEGKP
jgi:antitoxin (DNA-binding transcriptional repressor) of toxin-antitoxin stability system